MAALPVLHYAFRIRSPTFSAFLSDHGLELRAKTDLRFVEGVYKALRAHLHYSPALTVNQFFSVGFAERRVLFCLDVLRLVVRMHEELLGGAVFARSRRMARQPGANFFPTDAQESMANGSVGESWLDDNISEAPQQGEHDVPQPQPQPQPCPPELPACPDVPPGQMDVFSEERFHDAGEEMEEHLHVSMCGDVLAGAHTAASHPQVLLHSDVLAGAHMAVDHLHSPVHDDVLAGTVP